jgi:hypothetical protein
MFDHTLIKIMYESRPIEKDITLFLFLLDSLLIDANIILQCKYYITMQKKNQRFSSFTFSTHFIEVNNLHIVFLYNLTYFSSTVVLFIQIDDQVNIRIKKF